MEALSLVEEPVENSIPVLNPSTGETIADVPVTPASEVEAVISRVRANQVAWEELGFKGRRYWLNKLRDWMFDNADRVADTMQAETGKVRAEAMKLAREIAECSPLGLLSTRATIPAGADVSDSASIANARATA